MEEVTVIQQGQVFKLKAKEWTDSRCGRTAIGSKGADRRGHKSAVSQAGRKRRMRFARCSIG
jgi:hypothetical protein